MGKPSKAKASEKKKGERKRAHASMVAAAKPERPIPTGHPVNKLRSYLGAI